MCRSAGESNNLNTYVPGVRTFPGISTGALKVNTVFLSHVSALAGSKTAPPSSAIENSVGSIFNRVISFTSLYPRLKLCAQPVVNAGIWIAEDDDNRPRTNTLWHA